MFLYLAFTCPRFDFKVDGSCSEPEYDMFMQCETECKLEKMARDLQDL